MGHLKKYRISTEEKRLFKRTLEKIPPAPHIPEDLFIPYLRKITPVTVELAVVRGDEVLLVHRSDEYYKGWHFPGGFIAPGESFEDACARVLLREVGLKLRTCEIIGVENFNKDPRFPFVSLFFLCRIRGKALEQEGAWFKRKPKELLSQHIKLWSLLKKKKGKDRI